MKRRNREISIFSMSALDLFASALGAFILIAIVIFPYFPNTGRTAGPRPPAPAAPGPALERQLEEIRRQLAEAQSRLAEAREEARDREENQNLLVLVEVEGELAAARARLADAAADARDLEEIRDRLILAQGRLAAAQERERGLERALQDERRRKFLLITISWDRDDDVDLHIVDPRGREYYYAARRHAGSPAQFEEDTTHGPGNEV